MTHGELEPSDTGRVIEICDFVGELFDKEKMEVVRGGRKKELINTDF